MGKSEYDFDGVTLELISITRNKQYACRNCVYEQLGEICETKKALMLHPIPGRIILTEVRLRLTNTNNTSYNLYSHCFAMIDSNANQYRADIIPCDKITSTKGFSINLHLYPHGTVSTILFFPELEKNILPDKLYYSNYVYLDHSTGTAIEGFISLNLKNGLILETNASKLMIEKRKQKLKEQKEQQREAQRQHQQLIEHYETHRREREEEEKRRKIISMVERLEFAIYRRFNNILSYNETVMLDNEIKNTEFQLRQLLRHNDSFKEYLTIIDKMMEGCHTKLEENMQTYHPHKLIDCLDPRTFEIYVESMFKSTGYVTKLTPFVADGGIDIVLEKDGLVYGVQCKYYEEQRTIGSNEIQQFIGALKNIKAVGGFFVTTGQFSKGAKLMATNNNIELLHLSKKDRV